MMTLYYCSCCKRFNNNLKGKDHTWADGEDMPKNSGDVIYCVCPKCQERNYAEVQAGGAKCIVSI